MPTQEKAEQIAMLEEKLKKATIVLSAEFRGLRVKEVSELRRLLRKNGIEYLVAKRTLVGIAAEKVGKGGLKTVMKGPTALVVGYGEVNEPAKIVVDHVAATKIPLTVTGGVMGAQVLDANGVKSLAALLPKPVLLAKLMGSMKSPLYGLVYGLNFHMAGLARVLEGRRKQLEAPPAEPAAAAAPAAS